MRMQGAVRIGAAILAVVGSLAVARPADAQSSAATRFVEVANGYRVTPNITYLRASGVDLKLDVYQPRGSGGPTPTLIYMHGGGWTNGSKEAAALTFLPYMEMGWAVVNVQYHQRALGGQRHKELAIGGKIAGHH